MNGKVTPHARNGGAQRLDEFAPKSLHHTAMTCVCYEVKVSRGDFLAELKHSLKHRIGMGPTWQLVAAMLRNQRRLFAEAPPARVIQQRLEWL